MENILLKKVFDLMESSDSDNNSSEDSDDEIYMFFYNHSGLSETAATGPGNALNAGIENVSQQEDEENLEVIPTRNDDSFKLYFKINRSCLEELILILRRESLSGGRPGIPVETTLLMTIWYLTTQEGIREVGARFGFNQGHVHRNVMHTCRLLVDKIHEFIRWPTKAEAQKTVEGFNEYGNFPNVMGCVGASRIILPTKNKDDPYTDMNGQNSLILQGICNYKMEFLNIYCGWHGSASNALVWSHCTVNEKLKEDPSSLLLPNTYLIGDSSYPLTTHLLVPYNDEGFLSEQQEIFNTKLNNSRLVIDQTFAILKNRFKRLQFLETKSLELAKYLIMTSCILHNVSLKHEEEEEYFVDERVFETVRSQPPHLHEEDPSALFFRDQIFNELTKV